MSEGVRFGRRVLKNDVNSASVDTAGLTNIAPSLRLKPVSIGIGCHVSDFHFLIGAMGMIPPSPSITG